MVSLFLSDIENVRQHVNCSVSPLFELAASLHLLASPSGGEHHQEWRQQAIQLLKLAHLEREWDYFAPAFSLGVPWIFHPDKTKGMNSSEAIHAYLMDLPVEDFRSSLSRSLRGEHPVEVIDACQVEIDLQRDPAFVKGRFQLFVYTFWEMIFSLIWKELSPVFERELEAIEAALADGEQFLRFVQTVTSHAIHLPQLSGARHDKGATEITAIWLYPSWFFAGMSHVQIHERAAHLLYNLTVRSLP